MLLRSFLLLFVLTGLCLAEAPWPQFLGPQRSGVATETVKLAASFPADGPKIVWKYECGSGFAGPVVADGHVLLFHRVKGEATLDALDPATGQRAWTYHYATDYQDSFGFDDGPRSSPTVAGGRVFLYGAEGQVHAVDAKSGKLLWKRDLVAEYQSAQGFFGRAGAPLVVGDLVLVCPGGTVSVVALDVASGATKWTAGDQAAGYASPVLWPSASGPVVVSWLREGLLGMDPATGKVKFSAAHRSRQEASVNAATPVIISPTEIFTSACYDTGATLWKYSEEQWSKGWTTHDQLDAHYATPIYAAGYLYGLHGRQEQGQELRCISATTGKVQWASPHLAAGEGIAADGKWIVITDRGECLLVALTAEKYHLLDRGQILSAGHRSPPALAGGVLYARDKTKLVAVSLTE